MTPKAWREAALRSDLRPLQKLLICVLSVHMERFGVPAPIPLGEITHLMSVSRNGAQTAIRATVDAGWLERRPPVRKFGRGAVWEFAPKGCAVGVVPCETLQEAA